MLVKILLIFLPIFVSCGVNSSSKDKHFEDSLFIKSFGTIDDDTFTFKQDSAAISEAISAVKLQVVKNKKVLLK